MRTYSCFCIMWRKTWQCSPSPFLRPSNPVLISWTALSMKGDLHTTNVRYTFVTNYNSPKPINNQDKSFIDDLFEFEYRCFTSNLQEGIQNGRIQVFHANSHCQQCTIKYAVKYTCLTSQHTEISRNSQNIDFLMGLGTRLTEQWNFTYLCSINVITG